MRHFLPVICSTLLLATAGSHAQTPPAVQPDPAAPANVPAHSEILILDANRLATEPTALVTLYDRVEELVTLQAVGHNKVLDALEAEFAPVRDRKVELTEEEYRQAVKDFNAAAEQVEAATAEAQTGITAAAEEQVEVFKQVRDLVKAGVLMKYEARGFVDASSVLYMRPGTSYDKTDEVIAGINDKLPSLTIDPPAPEPESATDETPASKGDYPQR